QRTRFPLRHEVREWRRMAEAEREVAVLVLDDESIVQRLAERFDDVPHPVVEVGRVFRRAEYQWRFYRRSPTGSPRPRLLLVTCLLRPPRRPCRPRLPERLLTRL